MALQQDSERLTRANGIGQQDTEAQLAALLRSAYAQLLADVLALRARRGSQPVVIGLCGAQGSGKSTLTRVLQTALQDEHGLAVAVIALDDLYPPEQWQPCRWPLAPLCQ